MRVGSLFSGCGMFDLAFQNAEFDIAWQVEIDRTARDVLARHWPNVERHNDVCEVNAANLAPVDVIVGGFPCQDVSTAGARGGFEKGERSVLFFEMVRVIRELRPVCVVWENVPGLLSANEGRNFLRVLVELADLGFHGGWRTLDAQFFGVPQQRRRVFGVFTRGHLGIERTAEILALTQGVRGRSPTRRKAGKGVAAPLTGGSRSCGVSAPGRRQEDDQNLVVGALQASEGGADDNAAQAGHLIVFGCGKESGERRVAAALTAKGQRQDFDTDNFVLIQDARAGADTKSQSGLGVRESSIAYTVDTTGSQAVTVPCLAPDGTPKGREDGLAYTLTGRAQRGHGNGKSVAVAFAQNQRGEVRFVDPPPALTAGGGKPGEGYPAALVGDVVRRLTPRECERLMGLPDDWTRWRANGKEIADGPRYRMCGNGVVRTVAQWLAKRTRVFLESEGVA